MLEIPRTLLGNPANPPRILVAGVGNAGISLIDRLALAGFAEAVDLVAINTDSLSLSSSVAGRKVLIGSKTARGLGTGGDVEIGAGSAEEAEADLNAALEGAGIVILCAGLGGGVGGGATPIIAELARNQGAVVIALTTLPFAFEGRRRVQQATEAREQIARHADASLVFENDRMSELSEPLAGVHETFSAADTVLAETVATLTRLVMIPGPIRITPADLLAVFRHADTASHFGYGESSGSNRANEAVERALKAPLMGRGKSLHDARATLVHITASPDVHLAEIRAIMENVARHTDGQIHLGIGLDVNRPSSLAVAILSATGAVTPVAAVPRTTRPAPVRQPRPAPMPQPAAEFVQDIVEHETEEAIADPSPAPQKASELFDTSRYAVAKGPGAQGTKKPPKSEQKTLSLDPVARGRFEKSEPTIIGGEDLDVPTFLRQKIKLR